MVEIYSVSSCHGVEESTIAIKRAHKRKGNHVTIRDLYGNAVIWKYPPSLQLEEARALLLLRLHGSLQVVGDKVFSGNVRVKRYPTHCNAKLSLRELIDIDPLTASVTLSDRGAALMEPQRGVTFSVPESKMRELIEHVNRFFPEATHDLVGPDD